MSKRPPFVMMPPARTGGKPRIGAMVAGRTVVLGHWLDTEAMEYAAEILEEAGLLSGALPPTPVEAHRQAVAASTEQLVAEGPRPAMVADVEVPDGFAGLAASFFEDDDEGEDEPSLEELAAGIATARTAPVREPSPEDVPGVTFDAADWDPSMDIPAAVEAGRVHAYEDAPEDEPQSDLEEALEAADAAVEGAGDAVDYDALAEAWGVTVDEAKAAYESTDATAPALEPGGIVAEPTEVVLEPGETVVPSPATASAVAGEPSAPPTDAVAALIERQRIAREQAAAAKPAPSTAEAVQGAEAAQVLREWIRSLPAAARETEMALVDGRMVPKIRLDALTTEQRREALRLHNEHAVKAYVADPEAWSNQDGTE